MATIKRPYKLKLGARSYKHYNDLTRPVAEVRAGEKCQEV